jgi:predicted nucleic acid-binding protein
MILTDTGPLVALSDEQDSYRSRVEAAFAAMNEPMLTTQACVTEGMYLLYRSGGWQAQRLLAQMLRSGILLTRPENERSTPQALYYMERFVNIPCDYADATLLVAAAEYGMRRIFTFDKPVYAYRLASGDGLEVVP